MDNNPILTAGEAAAVLGLHKDTVSTYAKNRPTGIRCDGRFWPVHVGLGAGVWIAPRSVWEELLKNKPDPSRGGKPRGRKNSGGN